MHSVSDTRSKRCSSLNYCSARYPNASHQGFAPSKLTRTRAYLSLNTLMRANNQSIGQC